MQAGVAPVEGGQQRRKELHAHAGRRADRGLPALQAHTLANLEARRFKLRQNDTHMLQQRVPGLGQAHIAAYPLKQRDATQLFFEIVDLPTHRRLRH